MRAILSTVLVFFSFCLSADTIFGVYAGAGTWQQEFSGDVASGVADIDIRDDLDLGDKANNVFYLALEHPIPLLPNIRLQHAEIAVTGDSTLTRSIDFNGSTFVVTDDISTSVTLDQSDAVFYYEVLDNVISLDLGLAVRQIEAEFAVTSSTEFARAEYEGVLPLLYAKVRGDLPFTGSWISVQVQALAYDGNRLVDATLSVGWESSIGFGVEGGYRAFQLELDDVDDISSASLNVSGPYAAINFHF